MDPAQAVGIQQMSSCMPSIAQFRNKEDVGLAYVIENYDTRGVLVMII